MTRKITPAHLDEIEKVAGEASSVHGRGCWHSEVSLNRDTRGRIPAWHPDARHIAMMDPATTLALIAEVRELRAARASVDFLIGTWRGESDQFKSNGRFAEWAVFEVHVRELLKALGEEA